MRDMRARCIKTYRDGNVAYYEDFVYTFEYGWEYGCYDQQQNMVLGHISDYDGTFFDEFWNKIFVVI